MDTAAAQKEEVLKFRATFKDAPLVPISMWQAFSLREKRIGRSTLASKVTIPPPVDEDLLRGNLRSLLKVKSEGIEKFDNPANCKPMHAEWISHCHDDEGSNADNIGTFHLIQKKARNDVTLFYLSGGGHFLAGLPGSRARIRNLCKSSGAKAFTLQPRLAPQETLPTILLDTLIGYFYLLSPPAGSLHQPMDPSKIILVGDSAGANLHLAIIQFLQYMQNESQRRGIGEPCFRVNGRSVSLAMPAGCALVSLGCDVTCALPSWQNFGSIDWLGRGPWSRQDFPADDLWPTRPPRGELAFDYSAACHPIFDPSMCTDWTGAPPVWIACGQESFSDGIKMLAAQLMSSGVPTKLVEYEFMPHVWNIMLPHLPQSQHCNELWGQVCKTLGAGNTKWNSTHDFVHLGSLQMSSRNTYQVLGGLIPRQAMRLMRARRDAYAGYVWKGTGIGLAKL